MNVKCNESIDSDVEAQVEVWVTEFVQSSTVMLMPVHQEMRWISRTVG